MGVVPLEDGLSRSSHEERESPSLPEAREEEKKPFSPEDPASSGCHGHHWDVLRLIGSCPAVKREGREPHPMSEEEEEEKEEEEKGDEEEDNERGEEKEKKEEKEKGGPSRAGGASAQPLVFIAPKPSEAWPGGLAGRPWREAGPEAAGWVSGAHGPEGHMI
ncbi:unnamed protein product, partial [Gadus morhua 'NCC']